MTLSTIEKAVKTERALRQLRNELVAACQPNQAKAVIDYLINANDDSKARLFDLLAKPVTDNEIVYIAPDIKKRPY